VLGFYKAGRFFLIRVHLCPSVVKLVIHFSFTQKIAAAFSGRFRVQT